MSLFVETGKEKEREEDRERKRETETEKHGCESNISLISCLPHVMHQGWGPQPKHVP